MAKQKRHVIKHDNIVVFPGATQMLIREGHRFVEKYQYEDAVACFEKAFLYDKGNEKSLSAYAYALYELKRYVEAKEVCEQLLAMGTSLYIEVMELYITICMQLKEYHQVESIITTLIEEKVLPEAQREKFERLKSINRDVAKNLHQRQDMQKLLEEQVYELGTFRALTPNEQSLRLHQLKNANVRQFEKMLKDIIECSDIHPFVQSLALILLVEQEISIDVHVTKFGQTKTVNPIYLLLPNQLQQYSEIAKIVDSELVQDPSTLEMVQYLMAKHAIVTYPFEWQPFEANAIAYSYIDFVQAMLGKSPKIDKTDYKIIKFLQTLEKLAELYEE